MGIKIDGKELAKQEREIIKDNIGKKVEKGIRPPVIASILVGDDGGSISYMKNQKKLSEKLGVEYRDILLEDTIKEEELLEVIKKLNEDKNVDGIIIQLPLPKHLNEKKVVSIISPDKDIDGLTDLNMGKLYKGDKSFVPCTAKSAVEMIKAVKPNLEGEHVVVIGRSNIVGKPVSQLLLKENATVTLCHSKTRNLKEISKNADIIVCAIGKPGFITKEFIKEGAIVIDVGTTLVENKLKGDVLYDDVIDIAAFLTPVPGGVGAMTTTMLIKNTCEAWEKNVQ